MTVLSISYLFFTCSLFSNAHQQKEPKNLSNRNGTQKLNFTNFFAQIKMFLKTNQKFSAKNYQKN